MESLRDVTDVPPKATLESLPEELLLKIVKTAAARDNDKDSRLGAFATVCPGCLRGTCTYDHEFVANIVSEISLKFNRIARDGALWRDDKTLMPYIRHGSASICSLPDHLILKIVKMAAECKETLYMDHSKLYPYFIEYDHEFVAQTVAKISHRFMRIASHPDLWKGNVSIDHLETEVDGVLDLMPNDVTEGFCFRKYFDDEEAIPEENIRGTLDKCQNLNSLAFHETELLSWPEMAPSGNSLQELYLASFTIDTELFKNINMSTSLPNLKIFLLCLNEDLPEEMRGYSHEDEYAMIAEIIQGILLPDISESNKLQVLKISNGAFRFPMSKMGKPPLPENLERLIVDEVDFVDGIKSKRYNRVLKMLTSWCPNLKMLAYKGNLGIWPSSIPAWTLLEELYLDYSDSHGADGHDNLFWNVQLHQYLPNLKIFHLTNYWESMLPDMRGCKKLEHVHLTARFTSPVNPRLDMPFPKELKKLTLSATVFYGDWDEEIDFLGNVLLELMKKHLPECQILQDHDIEDDPDVVFTFRNPERGPWTC